MKIIDKIVSYPFYGLAYLVGRIGRTLKLVKAALQEGYENGARIG